MSVERESPDRFSTRSRRSTERGAVLIAGLFGVMVLLALGALVVDLLRIERIARSLQRAADAGSLAGTLYLRGQPYHPYPAGDVTLEGWRHAKRAAVLALKENIVAEGSTSLVWSQGGGTPDPWDAGYSGTVKVSGNLTYTIERGAWYYREGQSGVEPNDVDDLKDAPFFTSLEADNGKCPAYCTDSVDNHQAANAVRVRVVLDGFRSFFPLASAGIAQVGPISREATASKNPS